MSSKFWNKIAIILLVLTIITTGLLIYIQLGGDINYHPSIELKEDDPTLIIDNNEEEIKKELQSKYDPIYKENYALNTDYVAWLEWENNLLYDYDENSADKFPHIIVKSRIIEDGEGDLNQANNEYLRHNIIKEYVTMGQEFMDASNIIDTDGSCYDQNIIIYGHYIYADDNLKFSPLHKLKDPENYEKYDTFTLTFKNEQRTYRVTDVFEYKRSTYDGIRENSPFSTSYSDNELRAYMEKVKNDYVHYLDTGIEIQPSDRFITLQTCIRNNHDDVLVVLGKEISSIKW